MKLNSEFTGTYYDFKNDTHQLKKLTRPYYIWILGNNEYLDQLITKIKIPKGVENYLVFSSKEKAPNHQILMFPKIGDYSKGKEINTLIKASKAKDGSNVGQFGFSVSVDLTEYVFDTSHLLSPASYKVTPPTYTMTVRAIPVEEKETKAYLKNYSHYLTLHTSDLREEKVSVQLKRDLPGWVTQSTSIGDTQQAGEELHKTYGLLNMLTGVAEAYKSAAADSEAYFTLTFTIEK